MAAEPDTDEDSWPGRLEEVAQCPACGDSRRSLEQQGLRDRSFGVAPGTWNLYRCSACGALYLCPRPDASSIHLAYERYYTHISPEAALRNSRLTPASLKLAMCNGYRNARFGLRLRPAISWGRLVVPLFRQLAAEIRQEDRGLGFARAREKRVLDVGCGNGAFLLRARHLGWRAYGIEPDEHAAAFARQRGCDIIGREVFDLGHAHESFFDAITLSHVIEHVANPCELLRRCKSMLRPGGFLWLETPNSDSMGYEMYGSSWRGLEAPRHLVLFNTRVLGSCLERAGFARVEFVRPADVSKPLFMLSEAIALGLIGEREVALLPRANRARARARARLAKAVVETHPDRAEVLRVIAHRAHSRT